MARLTLILGVLAMVVYLLDGFRFMLNEWRNWRNKGKWVVVVILCMVPSIADAACSGSSPSWTAVSPGRTDVSDCVTAASNGDTINVPAGSATWSSVLVVAKNLSIIGAGIGNTILTNDQPVTPDVGGDLFYFSPPYSQTLMTRLSGFTITHNNGRGLRCANSTQAPAVYLFRIDHIEFNSNGASNQSQAIENFGCRGLIDNNTFNNHIYVMRIGWGSTSTGTFDWDNFTELVHGSQDSMYVEDNIFTDLATTLTNQDQAGRWVIRYNTIGGTGVGHFPHIDIHGGRPAGTIRGGFGGEIYGNTFSDEGNYFSHRGGRALMFYNQGKSTGGATYKPFNDAGCPLETKEQMNNSYIFRNRKGATGVLWNADTSGGSACAGDVVENEDWFIDNVANDGTVGVGAGTLASRPATCTTGVGYWATTQSITDLTGMVGKNPVTPISGTLYKCTATDTWSVWSTPFTYPHPLQGAGQTATTPVVIGRVIRWMEVAAFVTGIGWHFRRQVMAVSLAVLSWTVMVGQFTPRAYDTVKSVSRESAVKALTVFNHLTKPRK